MISPGDSYSSLVEYSDEERDATINSPIAAMGNNLSALCNRSDAASDSILSPESASAPAAAAVADTSSGGNVVGGRGERPINTEDSASLVASDAPTTTTTPHNDPMVITRSRSRDTQQSLTPSHSSRGDDMVDRRAVYYEIGGIRFPPPQSYDDVSNDDIIGIAETPRFSRCSVLAGNADDYEVLNLYS